MAIMPAVTNTPLTTSYFLRDISLALQTYSRMRWFRSPTQDGLFVPISAAAAEPAELIIPARQRYAAAGLDLELLVSGVEVTVTFSGTDPLEAADLQADLDAEELLESEVLGDGSVAIRTVTTGTGATLEVVGGDGAAGVHLSTGVAAIGSEADTVLVAGVHEYLLTDQQSSIDYWYRVQFLHHTSSVMSPRSVAFPVGQPQRTPWESTISGFIRIADMSGAPIPGREVVIHNSHTPNRTGASGEWGVFRGYLKLVTDRNGYAEVRLLRGIKVEVSVTGSGFVRTIVVPDEGDVFDLLDPSLVSDDEFGIQEPRVDFALRTS